MIGTLEEVIRDMKNGTYDFTQDDKCSNCGSCCSSILPVTRKEVKEILRYIKKHNIKPCDHMKGLPTTERPIFDLTCPFRDNTKRVCTIYPVRPLICRDFRCDKPSKQAPMDKGLVNKKLDVVDMWRLFE